MHDIKPIALEFTQALARRDYAAAYALTTQSHQAQHSVSEMKDAFEDMCPLDWGSMDPIVPEQTMADWPGKEPDDIGWIYVSISGDMYSEAVTLVVAEENQSLRIRTIEYGRP